MNDRIDANMDFANLQNNGDMDVISQTITSDLEDDLNSYKKIYENLEIENLNSGQVPEDDMNFDENEYLNGSTAGFGKKLREINREIKKEELELEKQRQQK